MRNMDLLRSYSVDAILIPFYLVRVFYTPYHLLRYKSKKIKDYKITSNINFGSKDANDYITKKLKESNIFFEYGSGSSTLLAKKLNIQSYSVETDLSFYRYMKTHKIKNYYSNNLGVVYFFSTPVFSFIRKYYLNGRAKKFANSIFKIFNKNIFPDTILVDSRYRVLCCLYIFKFCKIHDIRPKIILDDFKFRRHYQVLKNLYKIKLIGRLGILELKEDKINIDIMIKKYQYDTR